MGGHRALTPGRLVRLQSPQRCGEGKQQSAGLISRETAGATPAPASNMAEVLACRACRRPLVAEGGCAICTDIKRNLVVEGDTENVPLAKLAGDTVRLLKTDLYRLELMQAKDRVYNPTLAAEGRRLSGAIAKLLDSTRKVIQDGVDAVEALSFQERAEILVAWFETLPPAYRRKIFEDLAKLVGPPVVEPSDRSDRHPTIPTRARS